MNQSSINSFIFLMLLIILYVIIGMQNCLFLSPQSIHAWAQCDRASVALTFYQDQNSILLPKVHNIENGTGITGMEFPLINYLAARLYKLFGFHEIIYRLLNLAILTIGLLFSFKLAGLFIKKPINAGLSVILLILSPVLCYYGPNFLSDVSSLGLTMIAWFYFFTYRSSGRYFSLALCLVLICLAVLIKISSGISLVAMILMFLPGIHTSGGTFNQKVKSGIFLVAGFVITVLIIFSWYAYAKHLNVKYNSNLFLLHTKIPSNFDEIAHNLKAIKDTWLKQYYSRYFYFFILASIAAMFFLYKGIPKLILQTTVLLWLGNMGYFTLMMDQFPDHDYYIITMLPAVFFTLISIVTIFESYNSKNKMIPYIFYLLTFSIVINGILLCKNTFRDRYDISLWMNKNNMTDAYRSIQPVLEDIGISKYENVLVGLDDSPQISLYLLNRKGITISRNDDFLKLLTSNSNQFRYIISNSIEFTDLVNSKLSSKTIFENNNFTVLEISTIQ